MQAASGYAASGQPAGGRILSFADFWDALYIELQDARNAVDAERRRLEDLSRERV
jgi:hypothetical protein